MTTSVAAGEDRGRTGQGGTGQDWGKTGQEQGGRAIDKWIPLQLHDSIIRTQPADPKGRDRDRAAEWLVAAQHTCTPACEAVHKRKQLVVQHLDQ
jgi:hypothetical protein